jgi:hypothetical protein
MSGDQIPVGTRFSAPVQTGSEAQSASYTMGTGSFPGATGWGVALTTRPHTAPRLKKEKSYTSAPLWNFAAFSSRVKFTFKFHLFFVGIKLGLSFSMVTNRCIE